MAVVGARSVRVRGFIENQGVAGCCGNEMKGYSIFSEINELSPVLTTFDDF